MCRVYPGSPGVSLTRTRVERTAIWVQDLRVGVCGGGGAGTGALGCILEKFPELLN